jgi:hypothetical protein
MRVPAGCLPALTANLVGGPSVRLVDLSFGGALVRCQQRILHGDKYCLRLRPDAGVLRLDARVLRSAIVALTREMVVYQYSLAFPEAVGESDDALRELLLKGEAMFTSTRTVESPIITERPLQPTPAAAIETITSRIQIVVPKVDFVKDPGWRQGMVLNRW